MNTRTEKTLNQYFDWFEDNSKRDCRNYAGLHVSFDRDVFRSYATTVGVLVRTPDGFPVLLTTDRRYSRTTADHVAALKYAFLTRFPEGAVIGCPLSGLECPSYTSPLNFSHRIETVGNEFISRLGWYVRDAESGKLYRREKFRREFEKFFCNLLKFKETFGGFIGVHDFDAGRALYEKCRGLSKKLIDRWRVRQGLPTLEDERAASQAAALDRFKSAGFLEQMKTLYNHPADDAEMIAKMIDIAGTGGEGWLMGTVYDIFEPFMFLPGGARMTSVAFLSRRDILLIGELMRIGADAVSVTLWDGEYKAELDDGGVRIRDAYLTKDYMLRFADALTAEMGEA